MRTLVHLSDLHFGRIDLATLGPLKAAVAAARPDLVVISGDLTQRAREAEFRAARSFLDELPMPQIVVPGNHDVPLHNLFARFVQPLEAYRRVITDDLEPFYADPEMAVLGLNTARSLTVKDGRLNQSQVARVRERLFPLGSEVAKIIVTHHPFDLPAGHTENPVVGRSRMAMAAFAECGADLFLAGHLHVVHTSHTTERYRIAGHSALVIHAGTATSTRGRGEANSFNVIGIDLPQITVERHTWRPEAKAFTISATERFVKAAPGWSPA